MPETWEPCCSSFLAGAVTALRPAVMGRPAVVQPIVVAIPPSAPRTASVWSASATRPAEATFVAVTGCAAIARATPTAPVTSPSATRAAAAVTSATATGTVRPVRAVTRVAIASRDAKAPRRATQTRCARVACAWSAVAIATAQVTSRSAGAVAVASVETRPTAARGSRIASMATARSACRTRIAVPARCAPTTTTATEPCRD
jgi:hypothetical protein